MESNGNGTEVQCLLITNGYIHQQNIIIPPEIISLICVYVYHSVTSDFVYVLCRFRPQNSREKASNTNTVHKLINDNVVQIQNADSSEQFYFDKVFKPCTSQTDIFHQIGINFIQTGAGKTYTLEGKLGSPQRGLISRITEGIFEKITNAEESIEFLLQVSYVEIYKEKLTDLLRPGTAAENLKIRKNNYGMYIENMTEMYVRDCEEVIGLFSMGAGNRSVANQYMSAVSSRSHRIFMMKLTQSNTDTKETYVSNVRFFDLGGSEKAGLVSEEAQKINHSLEQLRCINNMTPMDSVLTRLMTEELCGNCRTTFIINCSPSALNVTETIESCRFGEKLRFIKNC